MAGTFSVPARLPRSCAPPLGAVELVSRKRKQVDLHLPHVDGQMPRRLHRVGVEKHALFAANPPDGGDGLDGADLVVGKHHRNQRGVRADGCRHLLRGDQPGCVHIQQRDRKALFFELFQRVKYGMMLKCRGNNVFFALSCPQPRSRVKSLVVGFAAAGGEGDLPRFRAETGGDAPSRVLQRLSGLLGKGI